MEKNTNTQQTLVWKKGLPVSIKGVYTSKYLNRCQSPEEWWNIVDTQEVRNIIHACRQGDDSKKISLPAMIPVGETAEGYVRSEANTRLRIVPDFQGNDQNLVLFDFDHIDDRDVLINVLKKWKELSRGDDRELDTLYLAISARGHGFHAVITTYGFEDCESILEVQHKVCNEFFNEYDLISTNKLDPRVHIKSDLLFCSLKEETFKLSNRLFM